MSLEQTNFPLGFFPSVSQVSNLDFCYLSEDAVKMFFFLLKYTPCSCLFRQSITRDSVPSVFISAPNLLSVESLLTGALMLLFEL